jgi:hypothetical protein
MKPNIAVFINPTLLNFKLGSAPITFEIRGAGNEMGLIPFLDDVPAKKMYFFAMVKCFFLTGAF